jgi:hypothetical protein
MSLPANLLRQNPHLLWDSRRLWSLADMINFALGRFVMGRNILQSMLNQTAGRAHSDTHKLLPNEAAEFFETHAKLVITYCIEEPQLSDLAFLGVEVENLVSNYKFQRYTWNRINNLLQRHGTS